MLFSIKKNFFVLACALAFTNLAYAAQICRICLDNKTVKFELWSNIKGDLIDVATTSAQCDNDVSATGRFQYRAQNNVAYMSSIGINEQCNLNEGSGNDRKWTRCCDIAYSG